MRAINRNCKAHALHVQVPLVYEQLRIKVNCVLPCTRVCVQRRYVFGMLYRVLFVKELSKRC